MESIKSLVNSENQNKLSKHITMELQVFFYT